MINNNNKNKSEKRSNAVEISGEYKSFVSVASNTCDGIARDLESSVVAEGDGRKSGIRRDWC